MIPQGVQVFALDPVDMRCSCDRLSGIAKEQVGYESRSGALFVFYGRRRDALKMLFFDGSGMCIFYNGWTEIPSACPSPGEKVVQGGIPEEGPGGEETDHGLSANRIVLPSTL